ncbi:CidA/LrgA family protein [Dongia sp.]|uniref:CidA/LrgA family protein n=1 Tax=Dongia sp. TaxID=1977262 RepID=UPI0035B4993E
MLKGLATLLVFQLAGEFLAQILALPLPGPVIGMALLLTAFLIFKRVPDWLEPVADGLLRHFSLLFVPASVGLVQYLDRIGAEWLPILIALVVSTILGIAASAITFVLVARLVRADPAADERKVE